MRIAIVGGSFDPIHNGHIQMANQSLQALQVDEVWFMSTSSTVDKIGRASCRERV